MTYLFAKVGWDEFYDGSLLPQGHFRAPSLSGEAYERYNFKDVNGRVYGHVPPISRFRRPPQRSVDVLLFVAKHIASGDWRCVGFYLQPTMVRNYIDRPEYSLNRNFSLSAYRDTFKYCVQAPTSSSRRLTLIERGAYGTLRLPDTFRRPFMYAMSSGPSQATRDLATQAERIVARSLEVRNRD